MGRVRLKFAIKCLVTVVLLWVALRSVEIGAVTSLLSNLDPASAVASLFLTALIIIFDAVLLAEVIRTLFARRMPFVTAMIYSFVGWFFANVAPSTVGGDVFRGVQLSRAGMPIGAAVRVILSMRILSFVTLIAVIAAGFPIALELLHRQRDVMLLGGTLAIGVGAIFALLLLAYWRAPLIWADRWPQLRKLTSIATDFRQLIVPSVSGAAAWFAALAPHLLRLAILVALAKGLGLGIPIAILFAFTTAALLLTMIPISFGGWGVREVAFVYLLGAAGVSADAALSLSIAFGLLRMIVGAVGGVAWVLIGEEHFSFDASSA
jgi:uncharacterized membrane protein YbhN (UPF0104 family)